MSGASPARRRGALEQVTCASSQLLRINDLEPLLHEHAYACTDLCQMVLLKLTDFIQ